MRVYDSALNRAKLVTVRLANISNTPVSLHSLRIGVLVALFAAGVPSHVKQLAGRWTSEKSFIAYTRATMEQYHDIATVLNNPHLVTIYHIRQLYSHRYFAA
jgi:hypothetical protein